MSKALKRALKRGKQAGFGVARRTGVLELAAGSGWRQRRLLVLCYHGVALDDEHRWNPSLYVSPSLLRQRFEMLKAGDYRVLPLDDAIARLYANDLPPRSVALTFDDGYHDFAEVAWPLLQEFGYPATVYLATFRCDRNLPIFNLAVPLMLWRKRGHVFDGASLGLDRLDLRSPESRADVWREIQRLAGRSGPEAKHALARKVSDAIGGDYEAMTRRRLLTVMRPEDVTRLSAQGLDVQLHTHHHRTPRTSESFHDEIARNRERILELTGRMPVHFCYPSGYYDREFLPWLAAEGIASATTCDPGMAAPSTDPFLVPRLIDHEALSSTEFAAWLTGLPSLFARKAAAYRQGPSLHETAQQYGNPITNL